MPRDSRRALLTTHHCINLRLLPVQLEKSHGDNAKDETPDMGRVRHPAGCLFADRAEIHELDQEPDTDE